MRSSFATLLAACALLSGGCFVSHQVSGSGISGEFYIAARRTFLGIPGKAYVVRCQQQRTDIDCERIMIGRDIKKLAPAGEAAMSFPGGHFGLGAAGDQEERDARASDPVRATQAARPQGSVAVTGSSLDTLMQMLYAALKRPTPATEAEQIADRRAVSELVDGGMRPTAIRTAIVDAQSTSTAPLALTELARRVSALVNVDFLTPDDE